MTYPGRITDRLELVEVIHADLHIGRYYTHWLDASQRQNWLFMLSVGDMGQGGTVDLALQQATDNVGSNAKAIAGRIMTQLTQAGGDGNDACGIELANAELDAAQDFDFVRARLDVLVASANACLIVFGDALRYKPPSQGAWTEIIRA